MANARPIDPSPGLYIHFPYCLSRCSYCDFNVYVDREDVRPRLLRAMCREMAWRSEKFPKIRTLFIGGGTPSLMSDGELADLFGAVRAHFLLDPGSEITLEANPGDVTLELANVWGELGVNRVSVGAQSFSQKELSVLTRRHGPDEIGRTVANLRNAGHKNISLDLIFAIPGQSLDSWRDSLAKATALEPQHLSLYGLTYTEGTHLDHLRMTGQIRKVFDELEEEMYFAAEEFLAAQGFEHYEISNYARPGLRSVHNQVYWRNELYIGIGPGGFSYLDGFRSQNLKLPQKYIEAVETTGSAEEETELIEIDSEMTETILQGLRTSDGIDLDRFGQRFGRDLKEIISSSLPFLLKEDLLETTRSALRPTPKGMALANDVALEILGAREGGIEPQRAERIPG